MVKHTISVEKKRSITTPSSLLYPFSTTTRTTTIFWVPINYSRERKMGKTAADGKCKQKHN
jgi:hypothetical protein